MHKENTTASFNILALSQNGANFALGYIAKGGAHIIYETFPESELASKLLESKQKLSGKTVALTTTVPESSSMTTDDLNTEIAEVFSDSDELVIITTHRLEAMHQGLDINRDEPAILMEIDSETMSFSSLTDETGTHSGMKWAGERLWSILATLDEYQEFTSFWLSELDDKRTAMLQEALLTGTILVDGADRALNDDVMNIVREDLKSEIYPGVEAGLWVIKGPGANFVQGCACADVVVKPEEALEAMVTGSIAIFRSELENGWQWPVNPF